MLNWFWVFETLAQTLVRDCSFINVPIRFRTPGKNMHRGKQRWLQEGGLKIQYKMHINSDRRGKSLPKNV
jgi:hypothetical protein